MTKLLKLFIVLMTLGLIIPSSIIAEDIQKMNPGMEEDAEDFDLKSLEDELRRLLEDQEEPKVSEKDTLIVTPSKESDVVQKLEIEYKEPKTEAFKQELNAQPMDAKEEVIILDPIEDEDIEEEIF